jgi:hypothetical protein
LAQINEGVNDVVMDEVMEGNAQMFDMGWIKNG